MAATMDQELLIQQINVESQALEHTTQALEAALGWSIDGTGFSRKLSSVRFLTESYQRHVERLFALEEIDGFMESISRLNPDLTNRVDKLELEHEKFRAAIRESLVRIDSASSNQLAEFDATCQQLRTTINEVLEHLRRENELLMESFLRDTGGEG
jgi:hypothetical protein